MLKIKENSPITSSYLLIYTDIWCIFSVLERNLVVDRYFGIIYNLIKTSIPMGIGKSSDFVSWIIHKHSYQWCICNLHIMSKKKFSIRHYILFVQALVAMLGSLYYGFYWDPFTTPVCFDSAYALEPCTLCRYARILMYPITFISLVWILRKKRDYIYSIIPLVAIWIPLETYHYYLQKVKVEWNSFTCTANNPCAALEVNYFGRLTIPMMCLIAFIVIGFCVWKIHWNSHK